MIDTPIYNEELMDNVLVGIAQNILSEMERQGLTIRGLSELSDVNYSQLTKIFNCKGYIGLKSMIKIAAALKISLLNCSLMIKTNVKQMDRDLMKLQKEWIWQVQIIYLMFVLDIQKYI